MKEIGGYLELERFYLPMLHEEAIALNCGRSCLAYLIEKKGIQKIALPWFLCGSVRELCEAYGVAIRYYRIGINLLPDNYTAMDDEWLYLVNYYGQLENDTISQYRQVTPRLIVDNVEGYFQMPVSGVDTLYSCRKFFGVPDGAFLYTDIAEQNMELEKSFDSMKHILGRFENDASSFYRDFQINDDRFTNQPIRGMSKLTRNLLHAVDYQDVKRRRTENFRILHSRLQGINKLVLKPVDGAFMYPLMVENAQQIKKTLAAKKIYIPTLWPNVLVDCPKDWLEWSLANNILPLPVDQRYDENDIQYLLEEVQKCIG